MDDLGKKIKRLYREQRRYLRDTALARLQAVRNQYKHKWRLTLFLWLFPLLLALLVVAYTEDMAQIISELWAGFSLVLMFGILLTKYRGVHLHLRFSTIMSVSLLLSLVMLLPFIFFIEVTNRWMAAIVVYNICLALCVIGSFGFYLLVMAISPPREPYG